MIFVLDRSELHDQKRLEGSLLRLFLLAKSPTKHRVCMPEVVLAEHKRASREAMQNSTVSIEKEVRVLGRYWSKLDIKVPSVEVEFQNGVNGSTSGCAWRGLRSRRTRRRRTVRLPNAI